MGRSRKPRTGRSNCRRPEILIDAEQTLTKAQLQNASNVFIYVVLDDGTLIIGPRIVQGVKQSHIDLAAGKPVIAAGEVKVLKGRAHQIDNRSGHYKPSGEDARASAMEAFEREGFSPNRYKEHLFK